MAKRRKKDEEEIKEIPRFCRDCRFSSAFGDNSCYCNLQQRRLCACNRYGRLCNGFEPKK